MNIYSIADDFETLSGLIIKDFGAIPSDKWALFVINNRDKSLINYESTDSNFNCKYDIVHESVENDDIATLFRRYQNEWISFETLVKGMTYKKPQASILPIPKRLCGF